jgi:hypothetical protein
MAKKTGMCLWTLQRGNPIEWHDGHLKGTGKIVKPYNDPENEGRQLKRFADGYYVSDDAGTFTEKLFFIKQLFKIEKKVKK